MNSEKKSLPLSERDVFQALKKRAPKSNKELEEWLATDEGKAALAFDTTEAARWGAVGRS